MHAMEHLIIFIYTHTHTHSRLARNLYRAIIQEQREKRRKQKQKEMGGGGGGGGRESRQTAGDDQDSRLKDPNASSILGRNYHRTSRFRKPLSSYKLRHVDGAYVVYSILKCPDLQRVCADSILKCPDSILRCPDSILRCPDLQRLSAIEDPRQQLLGTSCGTTYDNSTHKTALQVVST